MIHFTQVIHKKTQKVGKTFFDLTVQHLGKYSTVAGIQELGLNEKSRRVTD